jgi:hypothetical protein
MLSDAHISPRIEGLGDVAQVDIKTEQTFGLEAENLG